MGVFVFCFGLIMGSFFTVVIHRMPRGESFVWGRSRCPDCSHPLGALDLIPVVGYLLRRGRCRYCQRPIPIRYPIVELSAAGVFLLIYESTGNGIQWAVWTLFFSLLLILSWIDLLHKVLPNQLTLGGLVVGLLISLAGESVPFGQAVLGAAVGLGIVTAIVYLSRGGMGIGDAKLLGMVGSFLGPWAALGTLFWGSVLGTIVGVILIALGQKQRKDPIPFGPFLAAGALIVWLEQWNTGLWW